MTTEIDYSKIKGMSRFTLTFTDVPEAHTALLYANGRNQVAVTLTMQAMDETGAPLDILSQIPTRHLFDYTSLRYLTSPGTLGDKLSYYPNSGQQTGASLGYTDTKNLYCRARNSQRTFGTLDPIAEPEMSTSAAGVVTVTYYVFANQVNNQGKEIVAQFAIGDAGLRFDTSGINGGAKSSLVIQSEAPETYTAKEVNWHRYDADICINDGDVYTAHPDHSALGGWAYNYYLSVKSGKTTSHAEQLYFVNFDLSGCCFSTAYDGQFAGLVGWDCHSEWRDFNCSYKWDPDVFGPSAKAYVGEDAGQAHVYWIRVYDQREPHALCCSWIYLYNHAVDDLGEYNFDQNPVGPFTHGHSNGYHTPPLRAYDQYGNEGRFYTNDGHLSDSDNYTLSDVPFK